MSFASYQGLEPRPYLGSEKSLPSWCDLVCSERHLAAADPILHDLLYNGVGLEPAMRLADLSVLAPAARQLTAAVG